MDPLLTSVTITCLLCFKVKEKHIHVDTHSGSVTESRSSQIFTSARAFPGLPLITSAIDPYLAHHFIHINLRRVHTSHPYLSHTQKPIVASNSIVGWYLMTLGTTFESDRLFFFFPSLPGFPLVSNPEAKLGSPRGTNKINSTDPRFFLLRVGEFFRTGIWTHCLC